MIVTLVHSLNSCRYRLLSLSEQLRRFESILQVSHRNLAVELAVALFNCFQNPFCPIPGSIAISGTPAATPWGHQVGAKIAPRLNILIVLLELPFMLSCRAIARWLQAGSDKVA